MTQVKPFGWNLPSPLQSVPLPQAWIKSGSAVPEVLCIKRDDLIHPVVSGNKARKLLHLAHDWLRSRPPAIMTMGGNRSNFLHALGYLCRQLEIPLIAKVRGHQPESYGATLRDLTDWGVTLEFVDKSEYRRYRDHHDFAASEAKARGAIWLPEGGADITALVGLMAAIDELSQPPQAIFVPVGTGVTALGLALGVQRRGWSTQVIGVVVLKGAEDLQHSLRAICHAAGFSWPSNLRLEHGFCGRGFGKVDDELLANQQRLEGLLGIPLEPVYLTKCCLALEDWFLHCLKDSVMTTVEKAVLLWHTGGLQGNR